MWGLVLTFLAGVATAAIWNGHFIPNQLVRIGVGLLVGAILFLWGRSLIDWDLYETHPSISYHSWEVSFALAVVGFASWWINMSKAAIWIVLAAVIYIALYLYDLNDPVITDHLERMKKTGIIIILLLLAAKFIKFKAKKGGGGGGHDHH